MRMLLAFGLLSLFSHSWWFVPIDLFLMGLFSSIYRSIYRETRMSWSSLFAHWPALSAAFMLCVGPWKSTEINYSTDNMYLYMPVCRYMYKFKARKWEHEPRTQEHKDRISSFSFCEKTRFSIVIHLTKPLDDCKLIFCEHKWDQWEIN
jgi:hypothetical protein